MAVSFLQDLKKEANTTGARPQYDLLRDYGIPAAPVPAAGLTEGAPGLRAAWGGPPVVKTGSLLL